MMERYTINHVHGYNTSSEGITDRLYIIVLSLPVVRCMGFITLYQISYISLSVVLVLWSVVRFKLGI